MERSNTINPSQVTSSTSSTVAVTAKTPKQGNSVSLLIDGCFEWLQSLIGKHYKNILLVLFVLFLLFTLCSFVEDEQQQYIQKHPTKPSNSKKQQPKKQQPKKKQQSLSPIIEVSSKESSPMPPSLPPNTPKNEQQEEKGILFDDDGLSKRLSELEDLVDSI